MKIVKLLLLATMLVSLPAVGSAAVNADAPARDYGVYLYLDGIAGESTADKFPRWIELAGVEFETSNSSAAVRGSGASAGKAELKRFAIIKSFDASSIPLLLHSLSGKRIKTGQIVFATRGEAQAAVLKIDLANVAVTGYSFDNMAETIQFDTGSVQFSYTAQDDKGKTLPPVQGGWDFTANKMK